MVVENYTHRPTHEAMESCFKRFQPFVRFFRLDTINKKFPFKIFDQKNRLRFFVRKPLKCLNAEVFSPEALDSISHCG